MQTGNDYFAKRGLVAQPLSMQQKAEQIDATTWAGDLEWQDSVTLALYMSIYELPTGTYLCRQGDTESYMCLVVEGKVDVIKEDSDGSVKKIAVIGAGSTLGEMSLIDGEPRSASAVTVQPTKIFVLNKENYQKFADIHPKLWGKLAAKIAKLLSQRLRQTSGALVDIL